MQPRSKFVDVLSAVVRAIIALMLVGTFVYLAVDQPQVQPPQALKVGVGAILAYYFARNVLGDRRPRNGG